MPHTQYSNRISTYEESQQRNTPANTLEQNPLDLKKKPGPTPKGTSQTLQKRTNHGHNQGCRISWTDDPLPPLPSTPWLNDMRIILIKSADQSPICWSHNGIVTEAMSHKSWPCHHVAAQEKPRVACPPPPPVVQPWTTAARSHAQWPHKVARWWQIKPPRKNIQNFQISVNKPNRAEFLIRCQLNTSGWGPMPHVHLFQAKVTLQN